LVGLSISMTYPAYGTGREQCAMRCTSLLSSLGAPWMWSRLHRGQYAFRNRPSMRPVRIGSFIGSFCFLGVLGFCGVMGELYTFPHSPTFLTGMWGNSKINFPISPLLLFYQWFQHNLIPLFLPLTSTLALPIPERVLAHVIGGNGGLQPCFHARLWE